MIESLEYSDNVPSRPLSSAAMGGSAILAANGSPPPRADTTGSSSQDAPATEAQRVLEKSKYESSSPFRSRKGDRFS